MLVREAVERGEQAAGIPALLRHDLRGAGDGRSCNGPQPDRFPVLTAHVVHAGRRLPAGLDQAAVTLGR